MKENVAWPVKFGIKLLLGATGIDYRLLKRAHIIEHGRMEDPDFSTSVFERHVLSILHETGRSARGTLLELGPGDSVATGVLAKAAGFEQAVLVDAGCFADLRPQAIAQLASALGNPIDSMEQTTKPSKVLEQLRERGIAYFTEGIRSLASLAAGSIDHSFSHTVLQHVHRDEVPELVRLLGTLHARGSYSSHLIKFTDHFSGGYLNHRLPVWFMESRLVKRANLYTNRLSAADFCELFETNRLAVRRLTVDFFDAAAPTSVEYPSAAAFRAANIKRAILRARFLLEKL